MTEIAEFFAQDGPLAARLSGYTPRAQQLAMAEAVGAALADGGVLVSEAGTGTGKTFAYLVPALLSGRKVIVSTGTKTLQDQLYHRDLPLVREALELPLRTALLKGRANYLCPYRLDVSEREGGFTSREQAALFHTVKRWASVTRSGDIAEAKGVPEEAEIWPLVTSTSDNCLGQECPRVDDCFLLQARRAAQEADLVVINHHLLCADMAVKEEGFGEVLPDADAFILDEAHQIPEVAAAFFGQSLSSRQLLELARDTIAAQLQEAKELSGLSESAQRLETAVRRFRLTLGEGARRAPWAEVCEEPELVEALEQLGKQLAELSDRLELAKERGKGLENCFKRAKAAAERLALVTAAAGDDNVHWFETFTRAFSLNVTPLEIAIPFRARMLDAQKAWIFTSATLAVGHGFSHFAHRLGLEEYRELQVESPFDYRHHALLYVPPELPEPGHPGYTRAVVEQVALPVLEASRGRAFLLFTSHRALREAHELLEERIAYPLLAQGQMPRGELLERFREHGNAVLLGTQSFWEGVDVRGPALSCVLIDKLPFSSPGDPVLQARIDALKKRGGNPFLEYQLPNAVITLKQGVGRLIRDVDDTGVLVLCDPRLVTKSYGKVFQNSLPEMPRTRKIEVVGRFFQQFE